MDHIRNNGANSAAHRLGMTRAVRGFEGELPLVELDRNITLECLRQRAERALDGDCTDGDRGLSAGRERNGIFSNS